MSTPVDTFDLTYATYSYSQQQDLFRSMVLAHDKANSMYVSQLFEEYLKRYPLNSTIWNNFAKFIKATQTAEESEQIFVRAVEQNPRSHDLWHCYVSSLRSDLGDDKKTLEVTERALENIGFDYNSSIQWEEAIRLQSENKPESLKLYSRALAIPTKGLDDLSERFSQFFQYCNPEEITACYTNFFPAQSQDQLPSEQMIAQMKVVIDASTENAKQQLIQVSAFEKRLVKTEYDGLVSEEEFDTWKQYLAFAKENLPEVHVKFLYERALISQCDNTLLWTDYFLHLEGGDKESLDESQRKSSREALLKFCRSKEQLLKNLNNSLLFQWAEFQERDAHIENARAIYKWNVESAKAKGDSLTSRVSRWIEFERRVQATATEANDIEAPVQAILETNVVSNASLPDDLRAWGIHEQTKSLVKNADKKREALEKRTAFVDGLASFSKIAFVQLIEFISSNFSADLTELESLLDQAYTVTIANVTPDNMQLVSKLSRNHLRSTNLKIIQIRRIENRIRAAEVQRKAKEQLGGNRKRKNHQAFGDDENALNNNTSKHFKHN